MLGAGASVFSNSRAWPRSGSTTFAATDFLVIPLHVTVGCTDWWGHSSVVAAGMVSAEVQWSSSSRHLRCNLVIAVFTMNINRDDDDGDYVSHDN